MGGKMVASTHIWIHEGTVKMPIPNIIGIISLQVKVLVWYCYETTLEKNPLKHIFTRKIVQINTIYKKLY